MGDQTAKEQILANLYEARRKLSGVDMDSLDQDAKNQWAINCGKLNNAILKLENEGLTNLLEQTSAKPLVVASGKLSKDLQRLNDGIEVVKTISAGLNTISGLIDVIKA